MQSKQLTKLRQLKSWVSRQLIQNMAQPTKIPRCLFYKKISKKSYLRCESFLGSSLYLESEQIAARLKWNTECSTFSSLPFSFSFPHHHHHHHHHHHNIHNFHNMNHHSHDILKYYCNCCLYVGKYVLQ